MNMMKSILIGIAIVATVALFLLVILVLFIITAIPRDRLLFDYEDDNEIEHVNNQTKDNTNI
jgi:uncharacterized membrane protein